MIRTIIVDDEPVAREFLRRLLTHESDIEIVAECHNGREAVKKLREERADLVFLDIQMPGLSGFEVLQSLEARSIPAIVFVTAFDEYAVRAFDVHALDYLLKPFNETRFQETRSRVGQADHSRRVSA